MPTVGEPRIVVRVSAADRQVIVEAAARVGVSVARFVRDAALGAAQGSGDGRLSGPVTTVQAGSSPAPASPRASRSEVVARAASLSRSLRAGEVDPKTGRTVTRFQAEQQARLRG